jgi:hypothetical protein
MWGNDLPLRQPNYSGYGHQAYPCLNDPFAALITM